MAVEVGFEPTEGCPLTPFRELRTTIHHRPPASLTSADIRPEVASERPRTGANETKFEPTGQDGNTFGIPTNVDLATVGILQSSATPQNSSSATGTPLAR